MTCLLLTGFVNRNAGCVCVWQLAQWLGQKHPQIYATRSIWWGRSKQDLTVMCTTWEKIKNVAIRYKLQAESKCCAVVNIIEKTKMLWPLVDDRQYEVL